MRNSLDFSSWSAVLSTMLGLVLVSLVAVGIRLIFMQTLQRRRERENRQINERLKTLIAAYKTLGGSFTGNLEVDPSHRGDARRPRPQTMPDAGNPEAQREGGALPTDPNPMSEAGSERRRRIRDAVEAALSDVILLGTQEQVRLAVQAAGDMVAGRPVHVAALVTSLRNYIRQALDLETIDANLPIPAQGPLRTPSGSGNRRPGMSEGSGGSGGGRGVVGGTGGTGGAGLGAGLGVGAGGAAIHHAASDSEDAAGAGR